MVIISLNIDTYTPSQFYTPTGAAQIMIPGWVEKWIDFSFFFFLVLLWLYHFPPPQCWKYWACLLPQKALFCENRRAGRAWGGCGQEGRQQPGPLSAASVLFPCALSEGKCWTLHTSGDWCERRAVKRKSYQRPCQLTHWLRWGTGDGQVACLLRKRLTAPSPPHWAHAWLRAAGT